MKLKQMKLKNQKQMLKGFPALNWFYQKLFPLLKTFPWILLLVSFSSKTFKKTYANITESSGEGIRQNEEEEPSADQPNRNNRPAGDLDNFLGAWKNLVNEVQETLGGVSDIEDSSDESLIDPMDFKFQKVRLKFY